MRTFKTLFTIFLFQLFINSINAQNLTELWGMTFSGGIGGGGVIYKTDNNGTNQKIVKSFVENPGANPQNTQLCQANNNKYYGMTQNGGNSNYGVIFEFDPTTNKYSILHNFVDSSGRLPQGSLILANNGKLYGTTEFGGATDDGVLFEFNPQTNEYKKIKSFYSSIGIRPCASLLLGDNGKLYGTTMMGGNQNMGVVFEYDIASLAYNVKFNFSYVNGAYPYGNLVQASNGNLFGMTNQGGTYNLGVLFELNISNSNYYRRVIFNGTNGRQPCSNSLILASNNNLYGLTTLGGDYNFGVLFEYNTTTSAYLKKYDFDGTNGSEPNANLLEVSNGIFYGLTSKGGSNDYGVLFKFDLNSSSLSKKLDFDGTINGKNPKGSLIKATNGELYGMTCFGGSSDKGIMFNYNYIDSTITKIIDFSYSPYGNKPQGSLCFANNNKFYGMTMEGGTSNLGVLFEYNPLSDSISNRVNFSTSIGSNPGGTLIQATNNKLYGITNAGGVNDMGVLFEYDPISLTYTIRANFDGSNNGSYPVGDLVQASNGKLYGTTEQGGASDYGVIYEFDPITNIFTKKYDFVGGVNGRGPKCKLIEASNGNLYGVTSSGGTLDLGILFEFNTQTETMLTKVEFDGSNGRYPSVSLALASNGKLYGTAYSGYSFDSFIIFEYDPNNSNCQFISSFNGVAYGPLMQAQDGKLYGTAYQGGTYNFGFMYNYDLIEQNNNILLNFNIDNGTNPYKTRLVEICKFPSIYNSSSDTIVCKNNGLNLHVIADGNISYQWQVNEGSGFSNLTNNSVYSGTLNDSLQILTTSNQMSLNKYRCLITSTCPALAIYSTPITLTVSEPFKLEQNIEICKNTTYNWQGNIFSIEKLDTISYLDIYGCDSTYILNLTIKNIDISVNSIGANLSANATADSYQWVDCNNGYAPIPQATSANYTPNINGSYAVIITQGLCSDTSTCIQVVLTDNESIESKKDIIISPNPANSWFYIELSNNDRVNVSILDITGKLIKQAYYFSNENIDISELKEGVYLIKIQTSNQTETRRLMVQR